MSLSDDMLVVTVRSTSMTPSCWSRGSGTSAGSGPLTEGVEDLPILSPVSEDADDSSGEPSGEADFVSSTLLFRMLWASVNNRLCADPGEAIPLELSGAGVLPEGCLYAVYNDSREMARFGEGTRATE